MTAQPVGIRFLSRSLLRSRPFLAGLLILVLGGLYFWRIHEGAQKPGVSVARADTVPPVVAVEMVSLHTVPQTVEVTGVVKPVNQTDIAPKISARIQALFVHEGSQVHAGDVLAILDTRDLDASLAQGAAGVAAAEAAYREAKLSESTEARVDSAQVAAAQSQLQEAEAALAATRAKQQLVDAGPRKQERAQAALAVQQAQAQLLLAQKDLHRMEELYQEGAISGQQYDTYLSRYQVAKAKYESAVQQQNMTEEGSRIEEKQAAAEAVREAEAAVRRAQAGLRAAEAAASKVQVLHQATENAWAQLQQSRAALQLATISRGYAVLRAPFNGLITQKLADVGAMAMPGVPVVREEGEQERLELTVPERDLAAVHLGAQWPVYLDALGGRKLMGIVSEIAPQGDPTSHTYTVKVLLPAGSGARSGMFGRAWLTTGQEKQLLVPTNAVVEREGLHYVYVVDSHNLLHLRLVTLGDPVGAQIPVLSGLNEGEKVVANAHLPNLTDGILVNPTLGRR